MPNSKDVEPPVSPEAPADPRLTPPPPRTEADVLRHLEGAQLDMGVINREMRESVEASEKRHLGDYAE